jgi:hypothetical protein
MSIAKKKNIKGMSENESEVKIAIQRRIGGYRMGVENKTFLTVLLTVFQYHVHEKWHTTSVRGLL